MTFDLAELASTLLAIPDEEFAPGRLTPLLAGLALRPESVAPFVQFKAGCYTRNLVYADQRFELMVLAWDAGSKSAIHDHMGQQCWFVAHSGSFQVDNFALVAGGGRPGYARLAHESTESAVTVGMPDYRGRDNEIHRVSVPQEAGPAVSVHVYAKPIVHCLVFDEAQQRCVERSLEFDTYVSKRITLAQ